MRGGLMRIREGRLIISPLYLMMLEQAATDAAKQDNPLHGWQPFGHESDGAFEKYVAWVRCLRSRVFEGEVALETLHHGMIWLSGVPKITVQSTPLALHEAVSRVPTASKKKARTSARRGGTDTPRTWVIRAACTRGVVCNSTWHCGSPPAHSLKINNRHRHRHRHRRPEDKL